MSGRPQLSVVVVAYEMERELPRTLQSLCTPYQRGIDADDYEIIVVDNGSRRPVSAPTGSSPTVRVHRIDDARPSPASAANIGIGLAEGSLIGLIVDGARLASPGLLALARRADSLSERAVISPLAWHLGPVRHMEARRSGYDQQVEDELLTSVGWPDNAYELFDRSTLAASSARGWFGPMGESSALFMSATMWHEVGGLDEAFTSPGGGYVNHDVYRRACLRERVEVFTLLGEGTFHQIHGGAATSGGGASTAMRAEYEAVRGEPYRPPSTDATYLGPMPPSASKHLEASIEWTRRQDDRSR